MIFTALSFYCLFTAYFLYEEVMSVRLSDSDNNKKTLAVIMIIE